MNVRVARDGPVTTVSLCRPERRNAVDGATAGALADAFRAFDADDDAAVAVLHGEGGTFCAGADLQAGGIELALWCDLRVASEEAVLGVFCRRWGVPLIDGGTVRLPRLIGRGRALDLVLTGRPVGASEALAIGLVDRVVPTGEALAAAQELARALAAFPQRCLREDRLSLLESEGLPEADALAVEFRHGLASLTEVAAGIERFRSG